jgi:hypothetical protein
MQYEFPAKTLHAKALASRTDDFHQAVLISASVLAPAGRQHHCEEMEEMENVNKFPRSLKFSVQNSVLFLHPSSHQKLTPTDDVGTSHHNQIK